MPYKQVQARVLSVGLPCYSQGSWYSQESINFAAFVTTYLRFSIASQDTSLGFQEEQCLEVEIFPATFPSRGLGHKSFSRSFAKTLCWVAVKPYM